MAAVVAPNPSDEHGYKWRYWLNLALVTLTVLAAIANIIVTMVPNGAWLGLTDIQWHWVIIVCGAITALNAAVNRTPQVQNPPTATRITVENQVQEIRKQA